MGLCAPPIQSGKPAFGVGPGNVPAYIERTADVPKAVRDILAGNMLRLRHDLRIRAGSRNGCPIDKEVRAQFAAQGAYFLSSAEAEALAQARCHAATLS